MVIICIAQTSGDWQRLAICCTSVAFLVLYYYWPFGSRGLIVTKLRIWEHPYICICIIYRLQKASSLYVYLTFPDYDTSVSVVKKDINYHSGQDNRPQCGFNCLRKVKLKLWTINVWRMVQFVLEPAGHWGQSPAVGESECSAKASVRF